MTLYIGKTPVCPTRVVVKEVSTKTNNQDIIVTENGTYTADEGYTGLGTVDVQVPTGGGGAPATKLGVSIDDIMGDVDENGAYRRTLNTPVIDLSGVETVMNSAFEAMFIRKRGWLKNVSGIKTVQSNAFWSFAESVEDAPDPNIISFDSLEEITSQYVFYNFLKDAGKTGAMHNSVRFPVLRNVDGSYALAQAFSCFYFNPSEGFFDKTFPVLESVYKDNALGNIVYYKTGTIITFSKIKTIVGSSSSYSATFGNFYVAGTIWKLPRVTELSNYVWSGSYAGEIHFAAANQAAIEACSGYDKKWGFTNATIFFDLMLNITVNGVLYSRNRIIDEYTSWEDESGNLVYTDITTEPTVGTPVYSDAGITQIGTVEEVA